MSVSGGRAFIAALVAGVLACWTTCELAKAEQEVQDDSTGKIPRLLSERANGLRAYIDLEAVAAEGIHKLRRSMIMYYYSPKFYEVMARSVFRRFEQSREAISGKVDMADCDKVQHVTNDEKDRDRRRPYLLHMEFSPTGDDLRAVCIGVSFPIQESTSYLEEDPLKPFGPAQPTTTVDGRKALWSPCFDRRGTLIGFRALGISA